jgi:hypothetical protein
MNTFFRPLKSESFTVPPVWLFSSKSGAGEPTSTDIFCPPHKVMSRDLPTAAHKTVCNPVGNELKTSSLELYARAESLSKAEH